MNSLDTWAPQSLLIISHPNNRWSQCNKFKIKWNYSSQEITTPKSQGKTLLKANDCPLHSFYCYRFWIVRIAYWYFLSTLYLSLISAASFPMLSLKLLIWAFRLEIIFSYDSFSIKTSAWVFCRKLQFYFKWVFACTYSATFWSDSSWMRAIMSCSLKRSSCKHEIYF